MAPPPSSELPRLFWRLRRLLRQVRSWPRVRVLIRRWSGWWSRIELTLARRFGVATRQERRYYLLIPAVGLLSGALGIAVHRLIEGLRFALWGAHGDFLGAVAENPVVMVLAATTAGGALVALLAGLARQRVAGYGMGALIEAVVLRRGRVPARPLALSALAAVATVGAGGSLGKEGPMIRLGAMCSSWIGDRLGLDDHHLKILVGCGAAAGFAAAYNVPVGGAIFAMEVILGNFALEIFGPIVVASVISTVLARAVEGDVPIYAAPDYGLVSGWELLAFLGLGLVCALASIVFVFGVRQGGRIFRRGPIPRGLQPVAGMLLLGALALAVPHVLGGGYETITLALQGQLPLLLLLLLPVAKVAATALTAGSGCAGGMFTPSLFVGALVGGAYGHGVHLLWPAVTGGSGAYAAVGMAAIAAGTTHAPISAILILFEFTGNYGLILPLMIAAITASAFARRLYPYSTYTESLARRGVDLSWRMEEAVLAGLTVQDLLHSDPEVLSPSDSYEKVVDRFFASHRQRLYVVGEDGRLEGSVSLHDIKRSLAEPATLTAVLAHDLTAPVEQVVHPEDRLHRVAEEFASSAFERLPVVEEGTGRFLGVLAKRDLLAVYAQEVVGRPAMLATFVRDEGGEGSRDYVRLPPDFTLRMLPVPASLAGKTLQEAELPRTFGARVIEVKRPATGDGERIIPDAETRLQPDDGLIVLGHADDLDRLEQGTTTDRPVEEPDS